MQWFPKLRGDEFCHFMKIWQQYVSKKQKQNKTPRRTICSLIRFSFGNRLVTWLNIKETVYMSQLSSKVKIGRGLSNLFVNSKNFEYFIICNMHESGLHYDPLPNIVLSPLFQSKQHWPIEDWTPLDFSSCAVVVKIVKIIWIAGPKVSQQNNAQSITLP